MKSVMRTRRRTAVALFAAATLALTGCSGSGDTEKLSVEGKPEKQEQEIQFQAKANFAGLTTLPIEADLAAVEAAEENALLAPALNLQITELAQVPAISADVYQDISGNSPGVTAEGEDIAQVHAADGHVFYIAKYTSSDPGWDTGADAPTTKVDLFAANDHITPVFRTTDGTAQQGTVIISLPEGSGAEAATLRSETSEKVQALSVVTGERVSSEVAHIYETVGKTIEMTSSDSINESFPGWASGDDYVQGEMLGAELASYLAPKGGGNGWAGVGKQYVVADLEWRAVSATTFDESTIHVELENGDTIYPARNVLSLSRSAIAFEIPIETTSFKIVIETDIVVGAGGNAPRHSWDPVVSEFTIS